MIGCVRVPCSAALLALACGDPAFVSLGRNVQRVASTPDAGPAVGPMLQPSTLACAEGTSGDLPDDPLAPVSAAAPGCEPEPPPTLLGCPLTGESEPIDSPCEERSLLSCPEDDASLALVGVISRCTDLAYQLTVSFDAGCATAFRLQAAQSLAILAAPSVHDCVAALLTAERYACAQAVDCAVGSTFQIVAR